MQNSIKDNIKSALESKGYKTSINNINLLYQAYMSDKTYPEAKRIASLIRDFNEANLLKK